MSKKTVTITEARNQLFRIAEEVQKPDTYYEFTISGKPGIVCMSQDEFNSIMETLEILSNSKIVQDLREAENDFQKGEYVTWEEAKKELGLSKPFFILNDNSNKRYRVKKNDKKKKRKI